jgi:hypothetical protein
MSMLRILRHLLTPAWVLDRVFSAQVLATIEQAVKASEARHRGELRFAVEAGLDFADLRSGASARERAVEVFSQLRVWDTEENTGVLVYVQWLDHRVEIVADRGITAWKLPSGMRDSSRGRWTPSKQWVICWQSTFLPG